MLASYHLFGRCLALTALTVILGGCAARQAPAPPGLPVVTTSVATTGSIYPSVQLAGIIAPYQNVAIQSSLTEPADTVAVQEGGRVSRGQLLAQLDTADLEANLAADLATAAS